MVKSRTPKKTKDLVHALSKEIAHDWLLNQQYDLTSRSPTQTKKIWKYFFLSRYTCTEKVPLVLNCAGATCHWCMATFKLIFIFNILLVVQQSEVTELCFSSPEQLEPPIGRGVWVLHQVISRWILVLNQQWANINYVCVVTNIAECRRRGRDAVGL